MTRALRALRDHDRRLAPALLALATFALLGWRLLEPLGRDQGIFYVVAREWLHGAVPYRDIFEHKPPGIYAIYAIAYALDHGAGWGAPLLDTLAAWGSAWLIWLTLARENRAAAWVASFVYIAVCRSPVFGGWWANAQPEAFQQLAIACASYLVHRAKSAITGVAVFFAIALKFTIAPVALVFAFALGRKKCAEFAVGLIVPCAILVLWAWATRTLAPAWDILISFNAMHASLSAANVAIAQGLSATWIHWVAMVPAIALLPFAAIGVRRLEVSESHLRKIAKVECGVLAACILQLIVQRKYWMWHGMPSAVPLATLTGVGVAALDGAWAKRFGAVAILLSFYSLFTLVEPYRRATTAVSNDDRLGRYTWEAPTGFSALEVEKIGSTLKDRSRPDDNLLVWGFESGLYVRSGLKPATRWIYDYPLTTVFPLDVRNDAIRKVVARLPEARFCVVYQRDTNDLETEDSYAQLRQLPLLMNALERDYRPVMSTDRAIVLERNVP